MEHLIGFICGLIIGASGTFTVGVIVYVLVNASTETSKHTLFREIAARLELDEETPEAETTKPKPKNGRRKRKPPKRKPRKPNADA